MSPNSMNIYDSLCINIRSLAPFYQATSYQPTDRDNAMKRGFLCGELGEVRRRTRIKNRKIKKNYYDLKIEEQYGITVNEVSMCSFSSTSSSMNSAMTSSVNGQSSPRNSFDNTASGWPTTQSEKGTPATLTPISEKSGTLSKKLQV